MSNNSKITNLLERSLNLLKETKKLSEDSVELSRLEIDEKATQEEKEKLFNLQNQIDKAVKNGDLEAVKRLSKQWQ